MIAKRKSKEVRGIGMSSIVDRWVEGVYQLWVEGGI